MANQTVKNGLKTKKNKLSIFFILQNFNKILKVDPELWGCAFLTQNGPFVLNKIFLSASHCYHFHLPIGPFHCAKFKKILPVDPDLWRSAIFGPKIAPFLQMRLFSENLVMSLVSFIHAYIHAKNQSQILIYQWNIDD